MIAEFPNVIVKPQYEQVSPKIENIPPFIGCFVSDKDGKTLLTFEIFEGALESFLRRSTSGEEEEIFDLELIPMFISAFERFSEQLNFIGLSGLDLRGTGLKMYSFFCFEKFTVTFFLRPGILMKNLRNRIIAFLNKFFESNKELFDDFFQKSTTEKIEQLNLVGSRWLNKLNSASTC